MIKTSGLTKIYGSGYLKTVALSGINLEIKAGDLVAIMGPSGCGKSTLLNLLGLIDQPSSGSYQFNGEETARYPEKLRAQLRKKYIGFVFQNFNLVNTLTVFENVELPLLYVGLTKRERKERVEHFLETTKMIHRMNHFPQQLSGGQQQRVAIARAISNNPKILLADEPTGNLDSKHGDEVMNILLEFNRKGSALVMVTHSGQYANYCKKIISLLDGTIVTENIKEEIYV